MNGGEALRLIREKLGLTLRDVEAASLRLAEAHKNPEFALPISRLSDIETKNILPSLYRLYTFSVLYRLSIQEILAIYGVDMGRISEDRSTYVPPTTHKTEPLEALDWVRIPVKMDPAFKITATTNFGRMIMKWGAIPLAHLRQFENSKYGYGYIGTEDFTMYPLLVPGSFVQIDQSKTKIAGGNWRSEYERPIYFMQTRDGYICSWCELQGTNLIVQPHPLSQVKTKILRADRDVDIVGQVVGLAMRLDGFTSDGDAGSTRLLSRPS